MIGPMERRLTKLRISYDKRKSLVADKCVALWMSVAKRYGLLARKPSVLFIGYVELALGLGESFRNLLRALDAGGMPFGIHPFSSEAETRRIGPFLESRYDLREVYDVNVAYIQVAQLPNYFHDLQRQVTGARHNILRTYWELSKAPAAWQTHLERIDEIWAPNSFVADAFRPIFDRKITIVPACISVYRSKNYSRDYFGLDEDRFYFMFSFDYYSGSARKNPLGVVQAFAYAFPDPEAKVGLLIKSTGPKELDPTAAQQLQNSSTLDKRITILDRSLNRDEMLSLIAGCDCYISLHRSEGFGLGMAEALALGRAVIATDYSGNREYLTEATGFPVPFTLRTLIPGEYLMSDGQSWAEPDLRVAIQHMRTVFSDPNERSRRALRGRRFIEEHYSEQTVARIVMDRLDEIRRGFAKKN